MITNLHPTPGAGSYGHEANEFGTREVTPKTKYLSLKPVDRTNFSIGLDKPVAKLPLNYKSAYAFEKVKKDFLIRRGGVNTESLPPKVEVGRFASS